MATNCGSGNIREFKNPAKIIIVIVPPITEIDNSRILDFAKRPELINSLIFEHAKITRSTVYLTHRHRPLIRSGCDSKFKGTGFESRSGSYVCHRGFVYIGYSV